MSGITVLEVGHLLLTTCEVGSSPLFYTLKLCFLKDERQDSQASLIFLCPNLHLILSQDFPFPSSLSLSSKAWTSAWAAHRSLGSSFCYYVVFYNFRKEGGEGILEEPGQNCLCFLPRSNENLKKECCNAFFVFFPETKSHSLALTGLTRSVD